MMPVKQIKSPIKTISEGQNRIYEANKQYARVKCNCSHYPKDHYNNVGFCHHSQHKDAGKCGCTWYYPNDEWILRKIKKQKTPQANATLMLANTTV